MLNFFKAECQSPPTNNPLFGICDDGGDTVAYIDDIIANRANWIATVKNDKNIELIFTAIDKCVIKDDEYDGRGRCDGMLTSHKHLFLIELKDQLKRWREGAISQLESTIKFLIDSNDVSTYKHKKAFACNKRHSHFQEVDNELNLKFFKTYGFRIDVQAEILIV